MMGAIKICVIMSFQCQITLSTTTHTIQIGHFCYEGMIQRKSSFLDILLRPDLPKFKFY